MTFCHAIWQRHSRTSSHDYDVKNEIYICSMLSGQHLRSPSSQCRIHARRLCFRHSKSFSLTLTCLEFTRCPISLTLFYVQRLSPCSDCRPSTSTTIPAVATSTTTIAATTIINLLHHVTISIKATTTVTLLSRAPLQQ